MKENLTANALDSNELSNDSLVSWVREVHNPEADPNGYDLTTEEGRKRFITDNWRKKDQK